MEQWSLTVYKFTDPDRNSSPRLINEAVTASISGSFCRGEADVVQRTSDSHVYCNTAQPTFHQDESQQAEWRAAEICYFKEKILAKTGPNKILMLLIDCQGERAQRAQTGLQNT